MSLPEATPLDLGFRHGSFRSDVVDFSRQLIEEDGHKRSYSPIRADLWSCGLVLQYLASKGVVKEENPTFQALTRQLLVNNPRCRPLLHLQNSVTVVDPSGDLNGRLKRKTDAPPHDAKRLAINTVNS